MKREEVQSISFQIIGYAGDAFSYYNQAIEHARNGRFDEAEKLVAEGREQMAKAHEAQTNLLTAEAQGQDIAYSVIMVHAQDHLMNAALYENIAKEFFFLYRERREQ